MALVIIFIIFDFALDFLKKEILKETVESHSMAELSGCKRKKVRGGRLMA